MRRGRDGGVLLRVRGQRSPQGQQLGQDPRRPGQQALSRRADDPDHPRPQQAEGGLQHARLQHPRQRPLRYPDVAVERRARHRPHRGHGAEHELRQSVRQRPLGHEDQLELQPGHARRRRLPVGFDLQSVHPYPVVEIRVLPRRCRRLQPGDPPTFLLEDQLQPEVPGQLQVRQPGRRGRRPHDGPRLHEDVRQRLLRPHGQQAGSVRHRPDGQGHGR